jgi:uncharacterized protein YabE (DUF348 family)
MKSKLKAWFDGLSKAGKVSVISAGIIGASLAAAPALSCNDAATYANKVARESVQFETIETKDPTMNKGDVKVTKPGIVGQDQVTYKIGTKCNKQISKVAIKTVVKSKPVTQEQLVGVKEVTTETQDVVIPFSNQNVSDSSMDKGTSKVIQAGVNGSKKITFEVVKIDGQEQSRTQTGDGDVTLQPVDQITHIGTKVTSTCDPNYAGGCVPMASDVDCGGGSGNGPAYFYGTARVVGYDIYGLDRDGDGYACE